MREQEPISKLCDELVLQPTVLYRCRRNSFQNGAAAFQAKARFDHQAEKERIDFLEKRSSAKMRFWPS